MKTLSEQVNDCLDEGKSGIYEIAKRTQINGDPHIQDPVAQELFVALMKYSEGQNKALWLLAAAIERAN